jgi:hypothetical protein
MIAVWMKNSVEFSLPTLISFISVLWVQTILFSTSSNTGKPIGLTICITNTEGMTQGDLSPFLAETSNCDLDTGRDLETGQRVCWSSSSDSTPFPSIS